MLLTPLEQFQVISIFPIKLLFFDFSFTNMFLINVLVLVIISFIVSCFGTTSSFMSIQKSYLLIQNAVLFTRIFVYSFTGFIDYFRYIFVILSGIIGSFGGIAQKKLKSMLVYISVSYTMYLVKHVFFIIRVQKFLTLLRIILLCLSCLFSLLQGYDVMVQSNVTFCQGSDDDSVSLSSNSEQEWLVRFDEKGLLSLNHDHVKSSEFDMLPSSNLEQKRFVRFDDIGSNLEQKRPVRFDEIVPFLNHDHIKSPESDMLPSYNLERPVRFDEIDLPSSNHDHVRSPEFDLLPSEGPLIYNHFRYSGFSENALGLHIHSMLSRIKAINCLYNHVENLTVSRVAQVDSDHDILDDIIYAAVVKNYYEESVVLENALTNDPRLQIIVASKLHDMLDEILRRNNF